MPSTPHRQVLSVSHSRDVESEAVRRKAVLIVQKQLRIPKDELASSRNENFLGVVPGERTERVLEDLFAALPLQGRRAHDFVGFFELFELGEQDVDVLRELGARHRDVVALA